MQNDTPGEAENSGSNDSLVRPAIMLLSGVVIAGFVAGMLLINNSKTENSNERPNTSVNYTGSATVISFNSTSKYCYANLRHENGEEVRHKLSRGTCAHLELDRVIDIVDGQYDY